MDPSDWLREGLIESQNIPSGAKARFDFNTFMAGLKSRPFKRRLIQSLLRLAPRGLYGTLMVGSATFMECRTVFEEPDFCVAAAPTTNLGQFDCHEGL
jgi:hypothetical protein